jgi:hypothetical protein
VTIVSPFGLPTSSLSASTTPDVVAQKDDYPNVKFWARQDWNEAKQDIGTHRQGERGRSRAAQGVNVAMRYIEDENGQVIDGHRASAIRKLARSIWIALANTGKAPAKWSQADIVVAQSYRREMRHHFPELRLCENDWKVDLIASDNYPSWYSHNNSANKCLVKQEKADGDDISSPSSPTAKRQQHSGDIGDRTAKKIRLESNQPMTGGDTQPQETGAPTGHTLKVCIFHLYFSPANHVIVFALIVLDKESPVSLNSVYITHVNHS